MKIRHPGLQMRNARGRGAAAGVMALVSSLALGAEVGVSAPACAVPALGRPGSLSVSELKGKVVYLDFWASWCTPCAKSFPFMNSLQREFGASGLEIVAINVDEDAAAANGFLARHPAQFAIGADPAGSCAENFDVQGMPSTYLIDREGVVRHVHLGFRTGDAQTLRELVQQLLGQDPIHP